ncbi:Translin [Melampsora americana]|nr:Translin [Melampsora americana]
MKREEKEINEDENEPTSKLIKTRHEKKSIKSLIDFSELQEIMEHEHEIKEKIRESVRVIERENKKMNGILNEVHGSTLDQNTEILERVNECLPSLIEKLKTLSRLIPNGEYWKYHEHFSRVIQQITLTMIYKEWLKHNLTSHGTFNHSNTQTKIPPESLLKKEDIITLLNLESPLTITSEEYLHGLISLINELTRLSINVISLGLFQVPIGICEFVKELGNGFSMLNLKNDSLRKRFDSIKYDLKRLEEVVYDLTLRGLYPIQTKAS